MERLNYPNVARNERKPVGKPFLVTRCSRAEEGHDFDPNEREPRKNVTRMERSDKGRKLERI